MKKLLSGVLLVVGLLLGLMVFNTLRYTSEQIAVSERFTLDLDREAVLDRFAGSIVYETVSLDGGEMDTRTARHFTGLHTYFVENFPQLHETLEWETVNGLSLLYTWEGTDPDALPIVLMGHMDVVPVIPGTEGDWEHPPYSGARADGYVWGRGTMDDKVSVLAILEGVERLVSEGFRPSRTVYLAFGHDEEIGGANGARAIVDLLDERGVDRFEMVVDEGGAVADGMMPGMDGALAVVGVAEKGGVNLTLRVEGDGGHSSAPPPQTNIGILAAAIARLEADPFPMTIQGPARLMLDAIGPEMGFGARMALANLWITRPLVVRGFGSDATMAAMLHTTTAATIVDGGVKSNVLPINATATVNFRILPGETPQSVAERVTRVIDDERVQVSGAENGREPSPVSSIETEGWRTLATTIREVVGDDVIVAPYLVIGGTDARHYSGRSESVYRFLPARMEADALARVHGTNERQSEQSYIESVIFFYRLLQNLG